MGIVEIINNVYLWMGGAFLFFILFLLSFIFLILLAKKTHAITEFKAWRKGSPISLFFQDNSYCEWKVIEPNAGIITDDNYGAFIISERGSYIDKRTKNVLLPFDASFGAALNVKAAKLVDDLQYIIRDENEFHKLRQMIANDQIEDSKSISAIKTSINFGSLKKMMNAVLPHNINSKIELVLAQRMKNYGKVNVQQAIILFVSIFGAIALGALVIYLTIGKR